MRTPPAHQVDVRAIQVWRWTGAIVSFFTWLIPVAYAVLQHYVWEQLPDWIGYVLIGGAVIEAVLELFILPTVRWRTWRYEITEEQVYLQHGVFVQRRTVVPMTKVQHVDTAQGVILRAYNLSDVTIFSGAGKHKIPALPLDVADRLRDRIAQLAKVVDDDV